MATIAWLHQFLHQLTILKHGAIVQAEGLHPAPQWTPSVAVQDVGAILLVDRHHLALNALGPRDCFSKSPYTPMRVTVEAERVGGGQTHPAKALFTVDVVCIRRDQQTTRLQLNSMARTQCKSGPL